MLLASFPILVSTVAARLALGEGFAETQNLALIALIPVGVLAAVVLRFGRVYLSGFVMMFALWAAGTLVIWTHPGFRVIAAVLPLLATLIAFLVLPWIAGILLTVLSVGSIWLLVVLELLGLRTTDMPNPADTGVALSAIFILVSVVAPVCGQIIRHAVRQTIVAQQALSRSEKRLASILERTPDIIYRLDTEGRLTYVNDAVRRYGYDPLKMIGTRLLDYVHPEDHELARHRLDEWRTGDRRTKALEIRLLTSQGKQRVAEYLAVPVLQESVFLLEAEGLYEDGERPGHYAGTQGIARDITERKRAEEALKKSEEKYSKVFQGAPVGVAVASLDEARFLDVNEEFQRIFGYPRDELIGRSAFDIGLWVNPGQREYIADLLRENEHAKDLEVLGRTKNGDVRTVRYNGQLIDIGGVACLITTVVDITDRKRAEEALKESEEKYSKVFQAAPAGIAVGSLDEARFLDINEEYERILGYRRDELIGRSAFDIGLWVNPAQREHIVDLLRRGEPAKDLETQARTKNGDVRTVRYNGQLMDIGGVACLISAVEDITDRKRAQEALRKSEEKYSKVFQAAPAGLAVTSLDGARFFDVNGEFERIFRYRRDELIGRSALDIKSWLSPEKREHIINLMRRGELAKDLEMQCHTKNGDPLTVRYSGQMIDIEGTACLLSAFQDITDRKRLESQLQQAQKLEALGRLAGGIAHDFNNMLLVILGQAEMATRDLVPASPVYESIQEIRRAAERSAELTRQLLVFARKQDAAPRVLSLNHAVAERVGMLRRLIGENVALKWNPSADLWPVQMDPAHVDQILINFAVNARDAIADVGTLTLSTENWRHKAQPQQHGSGGRRGEWVVLTVTDTGSGMSSETLAHIFEPFFTTKGVGKGTGMGLATVYGIVEHNSGWIEVGSELGKGTTFRIFLPRAYGGVAGRHDPERTQLAPGRETVLVVDDDPDVLKTVRTTLERLGYAVIEAGSAEDALALAARHEQPLDLLITDVVMPEMNGRDLYAKLAASHPGIRVLFVSGYSANATGELPLLEKPFKMQELSARVREILDRGEHATGAQTVP